MKGIKRKEGQDYILEVKIPYEEEPVGYVKDNEGRFHLLDEREKVKESENKFGKRE